MRWCARRSCVAGAGVARLPRRPHHGSGSTAWPPTYASRASRGPTGFRARRRLPRCMAMTAESPETARARTIFEAAQAGCQSFESASGRTRRASTGSVSVLRSPTKPSAGGRPGSHSSQSVAACLCPASVRSSGERSSSRRSSRCSSVAWMPRTAGTWRSTWAEASCPWPRRCWPSCGPLSCSTWCGPALAHGASRRPRRTISG